MTFRPLLCISCWFDILFLVISYITLTSGKGNPLKLLA